ncbi:hypothetical protein SAMN02787081_04700 [Lysinibacillus fusiformis]|uniref:Uncharacterized protein n=2 Tax=Lysinibacillus fusiformis TaxID=28031 RepID=A0A1H9SEW7_9BACI|nr:hypothetical protein SAMN02787081_04700 [Lysinibacillus fusiformis]SEO53671.1 hypothetical protein SAMN02787103_04673 [Lysinibacillus fusiformis]SER83580.1 hypothetical protein SAMN02787113_04705 [Lysinibacillus fusiformis]
MYQKKRQVKPILKSDLKHVIYSLNYITGIPVQDIIPELCMLVMKDRESIESLSQYFKRNLVYETTLFRGHIDNESIEKKVKGNKERVSSKFTNNEYKWVASLTFALDCSISRTVAVLLEISMSHVRFVNQYIKKYLQNELEEWQIREFKEILRYVNKHGESHYSWASLLEHVVEQIGTPSTTYRLKEIFRDFIDLNWRD